ncbi:type VI secretion system Vgr family protein [Falsiroseomonas oryzae]|uniref:type VI secretion system Vgr family protein n=1 Tax=Falsiroseomonas oryzae TaxID=2766473 RepID=UPI0022EAE35C|nr:type VI secretion system tip protein TssI/VgrG [Roseomonas sp. MO-31]
MQLPDRSGSLLSMSLDGDEGVLAPIRLRVTEAISEPYEVELTAVHAGDPFAPADILQKPAVARIRRDGLEREFHGLVREYVPLGQDIRGLHACQLKIVPKLWGLSLANDCRIFQEKTAQEIIEALLTDGGITGTEFRITGANEPLPYRTQYNENRLRFARRIMEEAGWFYFFEGEALVVTDANASLADLGALPAEGALVEGLRHVHAIAGGKEATADYDPVSPTTEVKGEQATVLKATGSLSPDSFLWPAGTDDPEAATTRARLRMEAAEASASLLAGGGTWIAMAAGHIFEVLGSDPFLPPGKYGVRSVVHEAEDESWLNAGALPSYSNSVEVFPEARPWRERLATRRPRMDGVHAALVIGEDSEGEIYTDDLGRVKVKFFWDHRAETAPNQAVWARVVQPWAGKGWGAQFIPRVGTEVAVAFMDGDPDRPVVLGGLYNGVDTPIFAKSEKMKSGFRTRSADKGGTADFSEFSFDDTKGSELVFLHAQKDYKIEVEHDLNLKVDNCRIVEVKVDDTQLVKGKGTYTIKGDHAVTVEEGNSTFTVKTGNFEETVETGNYKTQVKTGNYDALVDTGNYKLGVKSGSVDVKADAGAITIEAAQSITLKVGSNTVEISASGITVKGTMVTVKGEGQVSVASPMTEVKGDGMLTLKGGMVNIN